MANVLITGTTAVIFTKTVSCDCKFYCYITCQKNML